MMTNDIWCHLSDKIIRRHDDKWHLLSCHLLYRKRYYNVRRDQNPKSLAPPPPTPQTAWAIEPIFRLGVHQRHRIGVTLAIFEFPSGTPKNWPPRFWGPHPQWALGGLFLGVPDGNSKIAMVTPVLCPWSAPSPKMSPIAPVVWAVGGGARDLSPSSHCNSSLSVVRGLLISQLLSFSY